MGRDGEQRMKIEANVCASGYPTRSPRRVHQRTLRLQLVSVFLKYLFPCWKTYRACAAGCGAEGKKAV
jgi:hypothetical protein